MTSDRVVRLESIDAGVRGARSAPTCGVADTLESVLACWGLVHDCLVAQGRIRENAFGIHTTAEAARPGSIVLRADEGAELCATLTIARDGAGGLPLDATFARELDAIRRRGRRLSEVGLLAHRGTPHALDRLWAIALDHALRDDYSAVVAQVAARHAGYYVRAFGFLRIASDAKAARGRARGDVLIYLERRSFAEASALPPGLAPLRAEPVPARFYAGAFGFLPSQLAGTRLAAFLSLSNT